MHIPPDWGVFGVLIVSFLVFWFIFGRLFFDPFLKLLGARERRFKDLSERTERLLKEERAAIEERERQLAAVRREAMGRREAQRRQAEEAATKLIADARDEAHHEMEQVRLSIENDFKAAEMQLRQLADSLAIDLAGRLLGRPLAANGRGESRN